MTVSNEDYQFQNKLTAWSRMNLVKPLLRILDEKSLLQPTEVQLKTIPRGLNTKTNILAAAETGSGKTFAFGLPLVQKIHGHIEKYGENAEFEDGGFSEETEEPDDSIFGEKKTKQGPLGLILCPTRELAVQVHDQIRLLATHTKVRTAVIIGGMSDDKQGKRKKNRLFEKGEFRESAEQAQAAYCCRHARPVLGADSFGSRLASVTRSSQIPGH